MVMVVQQVWRGGRLPDCLLLALKGRARRPRARRRHGQQGGGLGRQREGAARRPQMLLVLRECRASRTCGCTPGARAATTGSRSACVRAARAAVGQVQRGHGPAAPAAPGPTAAALEVSRRAHGGTGEPLRGQAGSGALAARGKGRLKRGEQALGKGVSLPISNLYPPPC